MYGWQGRILRVNLSNGKIRKEPLNEELAHKYVGGKGLNIGLLFDEIKPGIDPLGPDNKLIFGVGPACGTLVPGNGRFTVSAKSPLSGFIGDTSCGGPFGPGLKYAGYDTLIVEGKADKPVYLWIDDDNVEIRDAQHLWGKTTGETREMIITELGDPNIQTVCIGPAGENLVRFACIISSGRTGGRTGIGAVLGSKKLKAVAARGTKGVSIANRELLEETIRELHQEWRRESTALENRRKYGPGVGAQPTYTKLGIVGAKNFREGTFSQSELIPSILADEHYIQPARGCFACPVACSHIFIVSKGPHAGVRGEGVMAAPQQFCSRFYIPDVAFMLKAASFCDENGLDQMDAGNAIGYAMECFEAGILTADELDGLRAEWGNCDAVMKLIEMIVYRKGIGDLLAEGATRASKVIGKGSEKFDMSSKGMSIDSRDPRGSKGWALAYAVSSRGADHCRHLLIDFDSGGGTPAWYKDIFKGFKGLDRFSEEGKAEILKWHEDVRGFQHCLEMCMFTHPYGTKQPYPVLLAKLYNGVTGLGIAEDEVNIIGERVINLERVFNVREGLTRKDDSLPDRFLKEPMTEGASKGQVVNLDYMLDEYYELRGWEKNTGFPTREKLEQLGLKEAADELDKMGKLARKTG